MEKKKSNDKKIFVTSLILLILLLIGFICFLLYMNTDINKLKKDVIIDGDGLYADEYEDGRYIYKGAKPNNYIMFNDEIWRILSIEKDGTLKIIRGKSIGNRIWDDVEDVSGYGSNDWTNPATLNTYLNETYFNDLKDNDKIVNHKWMIGSVNVDENNLEKQIEDENSKTWKGNVGLITASEYIRANTNEEECGNMVKNNKNFIECKKSNWIFNLNGNSPWTITATSSNEFAVWSVFSLGDMGGHFADEEFGVIPSVYLSNKISLDGSGTLQDPYLIS